MSMRYPKGTKDRKFNFKNQKVEQKKLLAEYPGHN